VPAIVKVKIWHPGGLPDGYQSVFNVDVGL
jgi:hypothetical protein